MAADVLEPDAERPQALLPLLGQQRDDEARVHAAGEQHAHGDVGDQVMFDRLFDALLEDDLRLGEPGDAALRTPADPTE